jgi:ParB family chromosome partitioning protein
MGAVLEKTDEPVDSAVSSAVDSNIVEEVTGAAGHDDGEVAVTDVEQDSSASSVGASGEDEWYTVVWVPPGSLIIGPNVRQENATPDKEGVRDIKKRGVRAPILAYRDESGNLVVTMGQMRTLSAVEAGVEKVPVWVQPPPSADEKAATIDRIIDQLGENDHRTAMTRGDFYRAHQQLRLLGLSATAIARRRSRSKRVIEDSLRVGESELASKAADKYDLTLEQAAVIAEFEGYGDLQTAKELILTAVEKPNNFAVLAQRKRDDRAEEERLAQSKTTLVNDLTAAGVTIFDESISAWSGDARSLDRLRPTPDDESGTELTADAHAECPGHGAWIGYDYDDNDDRIAVPVYGCADFRAHGHALRHAPAGQAEHGTGSTATFGTEPRDDGEGDGASALARAVLEREKARIVRRWVRENNKDWDAAVTVRHQFLANFARRSSAPKTARKWLAQQKLDGSPALRKAMERRHALAHRLLKLPEPGYGQTSDLITKIANATEAKATVWDMYLTLAAMEESLQRDSWRRPMGTDSAYMAILVELGYEPHDVERKVITPERIEDVIAAQLPPYANPHTHENAHDDALEDVHGDIAVGEPDDPVVDLDDVADSPPTGVPEDAEAVADSDMVDGDLVDGDGVEDLAGTIEALATMAGRADGSGEDLDRIDVAA